MIEIRIGNINLETAQFNVMFTMYCDAVPREGEFIQYNGKLRKVQSVLYIVDDFTKKTSIQVEVSQKSVNA